MAAETEAGYTLVDYAAGASTYQIPFDYLARKYVKITLIDSDDRSRDLDLVHGNDFTFQTTTALLITISQAGYDLIRIRRETDSVLLVDFKDGSVLTASHLTTSELQAIHIAEEGRDQTIILARAEADRAGDFANDAKASAESAKSSADYVAGVIASAGDKTMAIALASEDVTKGDALLTVKQTASGGVKRTQHDRNQESISPYDFSTAEQAIAALVKSGASSAAFNLRTTFLVTVGSGGDYATLGAAITGVQGIRPLWKDGNSFCEIRILSGFVHSEQLEFGGGVDLSWIKITSVDPVVYTNTSSFALSVRTYYNYKFMFYFKDGSNSPVFAVQFEENRTTSDVCAFVVTQRSRLNFYPYSGARKFWVGVSATYRAEVIAYHTGCAPDAESVALYKPAGYYVCDFSYCRHGGVELIDGVTCEMPVSKFEYINETAAVNAVFVIYGSIANFHGSSASYSSNGWGIRDGAHVILRDHKTIRCTVRGLSMIHTAFVDARRHDCEESIVATSGQVTQPEVEKGFYGCTLGVRLDGAGFVDVAGNDMRNCGIAVNADTGAVVSGKAVDISGSTLGFDCRAGSTVSFPRLWGTGVKKLMHLQDGVRFASNIFHVAGSTPTTDIRFCDIERADMFLMNGELTADSGVIGDVGSRIVVEGLAVKIQTFRSFLGSHVTIADSTADRSFADAAGQPQLTVSGGSFISATTYTNQNATPMKINITRNTLSAAGIIFSTDGTVQS